MDYLKKKFTVGAVPTEQYRTEWERIFAPQKPIAVSGPVLVPEVGVTATLVCICDHCKLRSPELYEKGGLHLCAKCAGLPPKVPEFWTCPDCGGTAAWHEVQLHRCSR